jgi:type I restriction enzyme R subunit
MLATYPFTNLHDEGIFGLFEDDKVAKVISIIKSINENAERG